MTDTKTKILEAAERVILENGPEGATIRRITQEAGVNVAAVNYHFGSKEDLGKALLLKFVGPIEKERTRMLNDARKNAGEAPLALETIIRCMFEPLIALRKDGERCHVLIMGIGRLFGDENMMKLSFREIVGPMVMNFRRELLLAMSGADETSVEFFLILMVTMTPNLMNNSIGTIMGSMLGQQIPYEEIIGTLIRFIEGGARNLMNQGGRNPMNCGAPTDPGGRDHE
ncbi:MAG: TetR/AcrR family transcriptional regulator [Thermoplasmata archaeon]|nr:TetR/AcrR family transcriptional regulator [Thermoplasmata archaeon]